MNMPGTRRIGPPLKYRAYLEILEDDQVYTPSAVVRNGIEKGLFPEDLSPGDARLLKCRIRTALGRFSQNHNFPEDGDGWVHIPGQPPVRGWWGWRWKDAVID